MTESAHQEKERSDGRSFSPPDKTAMGEESAHCDEATIQLHHEEKEEKEKLLEVPTDT